MSKFTELPGFEKTLLPSSNAKQAGKTVLITGGASGIGRQVAVRYVQQGARVVIGDLNVAGCKATVKACANGVHGGECFTPEAPCDVTSKSSTISLFNFARTVFDGQPPDIVIANAGVSEIGHLDDDDVLENELGLYPKQPRQTTLEVNLAGAILTAQVARDAWTRASTGISEADRQRKLILISSMGGWEGIPLAALYSMAKHGVLGYWVSLSAEMAKLDTKPFSCHAICPFFAATAILDTAILLALAGIPKTTPDAIAAAIEAVGRDSPSESQSEDSTVLLPDDKSPLIIRAKDFDPLSGDMYSDLSNILNRRQPQPGHAEYKSTTTEDIKSALSHNKNAQSLQLGQLLLGATSVLLLGNFLTLARRLSVFRNLAFGFFVAAVFSFFSTGKAKGRRRV